MPPKAKRIPHAMTLHGDTRIDNYYWLRDDERAARERARQKKLGN